jgi:hypothetical protein
LQAESADTSRKRWNCSILPFSGSSFLRVSDRAAKPINIIDHNERGSAMSTYPAVTVPTRFVEANGIRLIAATTQQKTKKNKTYEQ